MNTQHVQAAQEALLLVEVRVLFGPAGHIANFRAAWSMPPPEATSASRRTAEKARLCRGMQSFSALMSKKARLCRVMLGRDGLPQATEHA